MTRHAGRRDAADRRRTNRLGLRAERVAALLLWMKGYRILERGFTVSGGEIDIVARRGAVVAFVEVKARPSLEEALLAIDGTKRRRITRAAAVWLVRNPWAVDHAFRGDAILAVPRHWPRHVVDAFPVAIGH